MFILVALLLLIDYTADKEKFLFAYRFNIGSLPINILDVLIALACVIGLFRISRRDYPGEKLNAGFKWAVGLLSAALLTGSVGGMVHHTDLREVADMTRNVGTLAACIYIGYFSISTLQQARWAGYLLVISSVCSAVFVLLFMRETAETLKSTAANINELRSVDRGGDAGVAAAAFLAFSAAAGLRFFPRIIGIGLFALCAVGMFAMPHRSAWIIAVIALLFATLFLAKARFGRRLAVTVGLMLLTAVVLAVGLTVYANLTGRNIQEYFGVRLRSMLPGVEERKDNKPWETRLPGLTRELEIWTGNPLTGGGFGIQLATEKQSTGINGTGYRHNVWTAALAEGGLPLFLGYFITCWVCVSLGNKLVRLRMDQATVMVGAFAAIHGFVSIIYAGMTMTFNQQRPAIGLGLVCGLLLRTWDMQSAVVRSYEGYTDAEDGAMILPEVRYA